MLVPDAARAVAADFRAAYEGATEPASVVMIATMLADALDAFAARCETE